MPSTNEQILRRLKKLGISTSLESIQALLMGTLSTEDILASLLQGRHMRPRHHEEASRLLQELLLRRLPPEVRLFRDKIAAGGEIHRQEGDNVPIPPWMDAWVLLQDASPELLSQMIGSIADFKTTDSENWAPVTGADSLTG